MAVGDYTMYTPDQYGRLNKRLSEAKAEITRLKELLNKAIDHLDYCGYGDAWERDCSRDLQKELDQWQEQQREGADGK